MRQEVREAGLCHSDACAKQEGSWGPSPAQATGPSVQLSHWVTLSKPPAPRPPPAPLQGRVTTATPTPQYRTRGGEPCHPGLRADPLSGVTSLVTSSLSLGPLMPPDGAHPLCGAAARARRERGGRSGTSEV